MATRRTDEKYYEAIPSRTLAEKLAIAARDRIYDDFMKACVPSSSTTIIDVGVSDVPNDAANVLERKYPYKQNITAAGLGSGEDFRAAYPEVTYIQTRPNEPLPFADHSFDIGISNAVVEHLGSAANQQWFVGELLRVARQVFISVPNRFFPVEHHTGVPLLHYSRPMFAIACHMLGKKDWALEDNLILMSKKKLKYLLPSTIQGTVRYTGLTMGCFSSNVYLHVRR